MCCTRWELIESRIDWEALTKLSVQPPNFKTSMLSRRVVLETNEIGETRHKKCHKDPTANGNPFSGLHTAQRIRDSIKDMMLGRDVARARLTCRDKGCIDSDYSKRRRMKRKQIDVIIASRRFED